MMLFLALLFLAGNDSGTDDLRSLLPEWMKQADVPGMSVAEIRDGKQVWFDVHGIVHTKSNKPVTKDTVFQAASLSKPVFAYLCMRLVDQGKLNLDKPLAEVLPLDRLAHDPRHKRLTARMILSHRTGLPNWEPGPKLELSFEPGTSFQYSGEGYVYLSKVVEKITGTPMEELARTEVFEPLGMKHSDFVWRPDYDEKVSWPHNDRGMSGGERRVVKEPNAAASLHTNAEDYVRFLTATMKGTGLSVGSHREMFTAQGGVSYKGDNETEVNKHIRWGLGWGLLEVGDGTYCWHWGDNGDFKAFVLAGVKSGDGITWFSNGAGGLSFMSAAVDRVVPGYGKVFDFLGYERYDKPGRKERLTGIALTEAGNYRKALKHLKAALKQDPENKTLKRSVAWCKDLTKKPPKLKEETLKTYAGDYGPRHLLLEDGKLHYQRDNRPKYPLVPVNRTTFAIPTMFGFRLEVVLDAEGKPEKVVGHYLDGRKDENPRD
ncbi:MAG: serine hydrolase [Acidobacteriota bacterium]|nr:serine hydrolase [Acidobacteriota bacterium]